MRAAASRTAPAGAQSSWSPCSSQAGALSPAATSASAVASLPQRRRIFARRPIRRRAARSVSGREGTHRRAGPADHRAARRLLRGRDEGRRRRLRRARGRAAHAARRAPGAHARPEPARAGRRAARAARAGAPQPADALAREGDHARAGRRVLRALPRPAGRRDAEARRASRWRSSTRTGGSRGRSPAATGRPATTSRCSSRALVDDLRPRSTPTAASRSAARRDAALDVRRLQRRAPRQAADQPARRGRGTVRAKDPKTVAGRACASSRSTSTSTDGARADLETALQTLGFDAAADAHCDDAEAAQAVIGEIEATRDELDYDLDGAVLRLADRGAYAAAGTRSNSPRGALAFKFAAEEKTTVLADVRLGRRQDRQGRAGRRARAGVRRRHDGHARDARQPGGHPRARRADRRHRARAPRGRRDPVRGRRARRVQAHRRRAGDRAADGLPVVRRAADRAGQQPRALLHQRRLPGPDRAAADPLGVARRRRHRGGRPGVDRALNEDKLLERPVRLLRAHARAAARVRAHRRGLGRPHDRVDRGVARTSACGAR